MTKHFLLALALVLLAASPALSAAAYVKKGTNCFVGGTTACSSAITGTTAGNTLIMVATWSASSSNLSSVTATSESNLTAIGSKSTNSSGGTYAMQEAYLCNISTGGDKTVTLNLSANSTIWATVLEYSGIEDSSCLDATATVTQTTSSTAAINITTNSSGSMVLATIEDFNIFPSAWTWDAAYTPRVNNGGDLASWGQAEDVDVGAAGSKSISTALSGSAVWIMRAAEFKVVGGAAAPRFFRRRGN